MMEFRSGISNSQYAGECGEFREEMSREEFDSKLAQLEAVAKENASKPPAARMIIEAGWNQNTDPAFFEYVVVCDIPPDRDWLCEHCKVVNADGEESVGEGCSCCNDGWSNEPNDGGRFVAIHNGVPCLCVQWYVEILSDSEEE